MGRYRRRGKIGLVVAKPYKGLSWGGGTAVQRLWAVGSIPPPCAPWNTTSMHHFAELPCKLAGSGFACYGTPSMGSAKPHLWDVQGLTPCSVMQRHKAALVELKAAVCMSCLTTACAPVTRPKIFFCMESIPASQEQQRHVIFIVNKPEQRKAAKIYLFKTKGSY